MDDERVSLLANPKEVNIGRERPSRLGFASQARPQPAYAEPPE